MSLIVKSGATSDLWTIDTVSKAGRVTLYDAQGNPIQIVDKTVISNTQKGNIIMGIDGNNARMVRTDRVGNQSMNTPVLSWYDPVEGAAVNTVIWTQSLTTQTMTQANGSILFNASSLTTITTGSMINSTKQFLKKPRVPLMARFTNVQFNHFNNQVIELGFGLPTSATAATPVLNGAFLRKDTDGAVYLVVSYNGTETLSPALTSPNKTDFYMVDVIIYDDKASLIVFDSSNVPIIDASVQYSMASAALWTVSHLPLYSRIYNNTAPATAGTLRISTSSVYELYITDTTKPYPHKMAGLGKHVWNNPFTAFNQLANYTNNVAPTLRTPTNTTAAETTLGGQISWSNGANSFAASDTDLILFAYQNITPYQMYITDLAIATLNLGAANGANEYSIQYFIAINGTAISLATASYSRQTLGFQNLAAAAAVGKKFDERISENYQTPIVIEAGRFFVIGTRVLSGVATASQVMRTIANVKGYFE